MTRHTDVWASFTAYQDGDPLDDFTLEVSREALEAVQADPNARDSDQPDDDNTGIIQAIRVMGAGLITLCDQAQYSQLWNRDEYARAKQEIQQAVLWAVRAAQPYRAWLPENAGITNSPPQSC